MSETPLEVLIAAEVARWLRIKGSTVYVWAAMGKIPSVKLNGSVRFIRAEIQRWLNDRSNSPADSPPSITRSIIQPNVPSVSRHALQQAGSRAMRQVTKRHSSQQNAPSGLVPPTAGVGERKDGR